MPTSPRQVTTSELVTSGLKPSVPDSSTPAASPSATDQPANQTKPPEPDIRYAPRYVISSNFNAMVMSWIQTATQTGRMHQIMSFEYNATASSSSNVNWADVGFDDSEVTVPSDMLLRMPLFTASWGATLTDNNSANVVQNLHSQGSKARVTISATDCGVFQINPDTSW